MRNSSLTINFDRLPDFEVAPNVPVAKWQEQMEHKDEDSLLGEVIRFSVRVARLTQAATEVDKKSIKEIIPWAVSTADTIGISGHGLYYASRWLAYFWARQCEFAEWYNDGQPKSGFVPSQDLIRTLTKGE